MDGQKCELCRFWERGDTEPDYDALEPWEGACRRYPTYRQKSEGDWCGEYQPANPETTTEGAATMARLVLLGDLTAARALADRLKEEAPVAGERGE